MSNRRFCSGRANPEWRAVYDVLCKRKHPNQAIVVIARRSLVTPWYLLKKREAYNRSSDEALAYKMLTCRLAPACRRFSRQERWSWHIDQSAIHRVTHQQFAKYGLLQLGRGERLARSARSGRPRRIAPTLENITFPKPLSYKDLFPILERRYSSAARV